MKVLWTLGCVVPELGLKVIRSMLNTSEWAFRELSNAKCFRTKLQHGPTQMSERVHDSNEE